MTRKESPLAYNEYMHACASSLAAAKEVPSETDLVFHLELTREADRVSTLFNYSETLQPQRMGDEQMQIYLNTFSSKIRDWQARIPATMTEDRKFSDFPTSAKLYFIQSVLRTDQPKKSLPTIMAVDIRSLHTRDRVVGHVSRFQALAASDSHSCRQSRQHEDLPGCIP